MNYFESRQIAQNYASSILEEYNVLNQLALSGKRGKTTYLKHFEKLKNMIWCEQTFYKLLKKEEVNFLCKHLPSTALRENCYLPEILFLEEEDIQTIEWSRVKQKLFCQKRKFDFPILDCDSTQIGMVPLAPLIEKKGEPYYYSKIKLVEGCFNFQFSKTILNNQQYSQNLRNEFLYTSSYLNEEAENYYLSTMFSPSLESIGIDTLSEHYFLDTEEYSYYCYEYFSEILISIFEPLFSCTKEILEKDDELAIFLSMARDAFLSAFQVFSYSAVMMSYDLLEQQPMTSLVQNYLFQSLFPIITEKKEKIKKLSKKIT